MKGLATLLIVAVIVAVMPLLQPRVVHADTHGNTDLFEGTLDSNPSISPKSVSSSWWAGATLNVNQRYGCTNLPGEPDAAPSPPACPVAYSAGWHQGIDIALGSGTTLYSRNDGTVAAYATSCLSLTCPLGFLAIQIDHGRIIYLLHGTPNSTFANVGKAVHVGDAVYTTGANGYPYSTGAHLHFEVHNSVVGELQVPVGPGDDINPENWLAPPPRMDIMTRGADGQLYHKYWYESADNLCRTCPALLLPPPAGVSTFISDPATTWWEGNTRMDIYAEGNDGNLWQYWWANGQGGWASMGAYPPGAIGSDTPAVAAPSSGVRTDLFVIRGGQVFWKHYSNGVGPPLPDCFAAGCWTALSSSPVYLISHPAAIWFNQGSAPTLEVFAEGSNYRDYVIWYQNGTWSPWTLMGPYPNVPPGQYGAGPAAAAWPDGSRVDEYVTGNDGFEYFKYYTGNPTTDCWSNCTLYPFGWYPLGLQYGQPVSAVSDPGIGWWPWYFLRRIDLYFQGADGDLRGRYYETDGTNSWNVDFGPWPGGTFAYSGFAPAVAVWR